MSARIGTANIAPSSSNPISSSSGRSAFYYTQEGALESAVDPVAFQDTYTFFVDADKDQIRGYRQVYRDGEGLMFVSDAVYERYFQK